MDVRHILDLDRYPLHDLAGARGLELISACREALADHGMFDLTGFVRPEALVRCLAEVKPVFDTAAFKHRRSHNIYFQPSVPGLAADDPALRALETANHTVCADQLPGSVLCQIYEWAPLADFLAATLGKSQLFQMSDPLARINVMAYQAGEALNWHFDRSEFTTTLLLQQPDAGGDFEYRRDLRTDDDPNYAGVADLLADKDTDVRSVRVEPGTLTVFMGKQTAHRTTQTEGSRPRLVSVFSFYEQPGVMFSDEERIGFYGRAA
jgi:hypothetical protein